MLVWPAEPVPFSMLRFQHRKGRGGNGSSWPDQVDAYFLSIYFLSAAQERKVLWPKFVAFKLAFHFIYTILVQQRLIQNFLKGGQLGQSVQF